MKECWACHLFLVVLSKGDSALTPKCQFLHTLLGIWTNHYYTWAQIIRFMIWNLKCSAPILSHEKSNRRSVSYLLGVNCLSLKSELTTSLVDVSGACRRVMWDGIFMFLLQEGIMGSQCKHTATHRQSHRWCLKYFKGIHADLLWRTG